MKPVAMAAALAALGAPACGGEPAPEPVATLRAPEYGPVPPLPEPKDGPSTDAQAELGRSLFYDLRLSGSGHTSCDHCHVPATSLQDGLITPVPDSSYPNAQPHLSHNTQAMLNLVYAPVFRWNGSHTDVVEVLVFPLAEPNMALGADVPSAQTTLKQRLTSDAPGYVPLFQGAFGQDLAALDPAVVWRLAGRALLAFMGKAVSRDAPFDRWNAGDDSAMSDAAVHGFEVFRGAGKCHVCHSGPFFTDFSFHNISTSPPSPSGQRADEGRFEVTGEEEDRGAFLTPTLRAVIDTSPYFHDGSRATLRKVLEHLSSQAVLADPNHDPVFDPPPTLSDDDIADLIELLRALRGQPAGDALGPPKDMP